MSIAGAPVQLANGAGVQIQPPQTGVQLSALVLSNESPYRLTVSIGATAYSQPPFTAQLYLLALSNQVVGVLPELPDGASAPASSSTDLVPTWYQAGEAPTGTYPVSLTAQAVTAAIEGAISSTFDGELLLNGTLGTFTAQVGQWASLEITALAFGDGIDPPVPGRMSVSWYADAALTIGLGADAINLAVPGVNVTRMMPVRGPYVQIVGSAGGGTQVGAQVYASNRPASDGYLNTVPADRFVFQGDTVSGQTYALSSSVTGRGAAYYSNGGTIAQRMITTGATSGRFGWRLLNPTNVADSFDVFPNPLIPDNGETAALTVVPGGLVVPVFQCAVGGTGVTIVWELAATD